MVCASSAAYGERETEALHSTSSASTDPIRRRAREHGRRLEAGDGLVVKVAVRLERGRERAREFATERRAQRLVAVFGRDHSRVGDAGDRRARDPATTRNAGFTPRTGPCAFVRLDVAVARSRAAASAGCAGQRAHRAPRQLSVENTESTDCRDRSKAGSECKNSAPTSKIGCGVASIQNRASAKRPLSRARAARSPRRTLDRWDEPPTSNPEIAAIDVALHLLLVEAIRN